jgi:hypothetical protein
LVFDGFRGKRPVFAFWIGVSSRSPLLILLTFHLTPLTFRAELQLPPCPTRNRLHQEEEEEEEEEEEGRRMNEEPVESVRYAGGGATVANECFVPGVLDTHLTSPSGLCMTPSGSIVVSDHCIRSVFAIEGGRTHLIAERDPEEDKNLAARESSVGNPFGLACLDDGSILVADMHDNTIKKISKNGGQITVFAGRSGHKGGQNGKLLESCFDKPKCLCPTPRGDILVSEVGSHRIRLIILEYGGVVINIAGQGQKGYQEGPAQSALFSHPSGLACIRLDPSFNYLTIKPLEQVQPDNECDIIAAEMSSLEGPNSPRLVSPLDLSPHSAVAPPHLQDRTPSREDFRHEDLIIFVSDTQNHRIRIINNGYVLSLAGNGVPGMADGPCNLAQFDHPVNISMAGRSILVADTRNDRIRIIDLDSSLVRSVHGYSQDVGDISKNPVLRLERPSAMCMSDEGDLFVACEFETHAEIHRLTRFLPQHVNNATTPSSIDTSLNLAPAHHETRSLESEEVEEGTPQGRPRRASASEALIPSQFTLNPRFSQNEMRERSKSVDSGPMPATSPSNPAGEHTNPWGLVSKFARMLSLDEETMLTRVDSMLGSMGLRSNKPSDIQPFEPEIRDKTPTSKQQDKEPIKTASSEIGKKPGDGDIDEDEVITF